MLRVRQQPNTGCVTAPKRQSFDGFKTVPDACISSTAPVVDIKADFENLSPGDLQKNYRHSSDIPATAQPNIGYLRSLTSTTS